MKKDVKKLAIFDIDGTIFRSSLLIELINGLVEYNVFPGIASKEVEKEYIAWLDRKGSYDNYINKVIKIHLKYIKGCRADAVDGVAKLVVKKMKNRTYLYTRDLLKKLKSQGYHLVAISGSPTYIVSKFAVSLGFNAFFGSNYEIKDGYFSGRVLNQDIFTDKPQVLRSYLQANGLKADLKRSLAVGDTDGDFTLLEQVGYPIAFNPNVPLAGKARKKGWQIVVERKDTIYNLKNYSFFNSKNRVSNNK